LGEDVTVGVPTEKKWDSGKEGGRRGKDGKEIDSGLGIHDLVSIFGENRIY